MSVGIANGGLIEPVKIGVVVGSTRPGRRAGAAAEWVHRLGSAREDAVFELLDIAEFGLPLLDEPIPAAIGDYRQPHTRVWSEAVAGFDGYVFVVPEYNHSLPAALKNAIDFLYREWHDKAAGLVSYGITGGIRAGEHLRLVLAEVKVACVRSHVTLSLGADFGIDDSGGLAPSDHQTTLLRRMLDELVSWALALRTCRAPRPASTDREDRGAR